MWKHKRIYICIYHLICKYIHKQKINLFYKVKEVLHVIATMFTVKFKSFLSVLLINPCKWMKGGGGCNLAGPNNVQLCNMYIFLGPKNFGQINDPPLSRSSKALCGYCSTTYFKYNVPIEILKLIKASIVS